MTNPSTPRRPAMGDPPVFQVEMTREGNGWLIELVVQGVLSDLIDVNWGKYGAYVYVKDEETNRG
jgi:hypothetical protein